MIFFVVSRSCEHSDYEHRVRSFFLKSYYRRICVSDGSVILQTSFLSSPFPPLLLRNLALSDTSRPLPLNLSSYKCISPSERRFKKKEKPPRREREAREEGVEEDGENENALGTRNSEMYKTRETTK